MNLDIAFLFIFYFYKNGFLYTILYYFLANVCYNDSVKKGMSIMKRKTFKDFQQQAYNLVGDEYTFYPPYKNMKTPIAYKHNKCGYEGTIRPDNFVNGARCMGCKLRKLSQARSLGTSKFKERLAKINPNIEVIGEYKSITTPVACKCLVCGYGSDGEWAPYPNNLERGKGCPKCAGNAPKKHKITYRGWLVGNDSYPSSVGKRYAGHINKDVYGLNSLLQKLCKYENGWQYIQQEYRLNKKGFRGKAYDFYIKIVQRKILIEYDGSQHFTKLKQIHTDVYWEHIANKFKFEVIRIPYFLQLNTKLIEYLFNAKINTKVQAKFPQGFIVNGKNNPWGYISTLPVEYNPVGISLYSDFMKGLKENGFNEIVDQIKQSELDRLKDYGYEKFISYAESIDEDI